MTSTKPNAEGVVESISERIDALGDWRGETLARLRQLEKKAIPKQVV